MTINGSRTISDSFIEEVFTEMVVQGLVSTVFAGTTIKDSDDFLEMLKSPANVPVFALVGEQCVAVCWLNSIGLNHAYGHFCYFYHPDAPAVDVGKKVMDYWWSLCSDSISLDVILGAIPVFNQRAIAFIQKLGFVKLGEIPNIFMNPNTGEKWASAVLYAQRP